MDLNQNDEQQTLESAEKLDIQLSDGLKQDKNDKVETEKSNENLNTIVNNKNEDEEKNSNATIGAVETDIIQSTNLIETATSKDDFSTRFEEESEGNVKEVDKNEKETSISKMTEIIKECNDKEVNQENTESTEDVEQLSNIKKNEESVNQQDSQENQQNKLKESDEKETFKSDKTADIKEAKKQLDSPKAELEPTNQIPIVKDTIPIREGRRKRKSVV